MADPLVFMPVDRWCELKSVFRSDLPRSISGLTVLETEEHILKWGCDYGFKVYCPYGNVNNGIVALNIKKTYYEVIIQCPEDDTKELEEALRCTNIIDWSKCTEVPYSPKHILDCVKILYTEKKLRIHHIATTETFILDRGTQLFDVRLPPTYVFENLTQEYIEMANETWPHKYHGSDWYFELLIKAKLGYGLFDGKELIAWVFIKEMGALGHLYTVEKHRRKGYGELVLKLISNVLLKDDKHVVAFCSTGNWSAANLYKKLEFKIVGEVYWCNSNKFLDT